METTDNNEYDSDENLKIGVVNKSKGPKCGRILESSDDDITEIDNNETGENQIAKEILVSEHENNKFNGSVSPEKEFNKISKQKKKKRFKTGVLNDSDSNDNSRLPDSENDFYESSNHNKIKELSKNVNELVNDYLPDPLFNKTKFMDKDIYDAEGSSDEGQTTVNEPEFGEVDPKKNKVKKDKTKKNLLQRKSKQTAIEEIQSETQRLIRQSRISLPYHRPKQRTLLEFLNRRKSLPTVPLKTSCDELSKVWKNIEEREKTAELFYKSESDSDNDTSIISVNNVSDKANKSTVDNTIDSQEASLDFQLHYTETKTQNLHEEENLEKITFDNQTEFEKISESNKENEAKKGIETSESSKSSQTKTLNIDSINIDFENMNNYTLCNEEKVSFMNSTNSETSKGIFNKVIPFNQSSLESETTCNVSFKVDDNKSTEKEIDVITNFAKNKDNYFTNRGNKLTGNILSDVKLNKVPKLIGQPDDVIDLEKSPEKPGAVKLISRFMKHITLKPKLKIQENVVVAISEVNENGEIVSLKEETLKIKRNQESLELKVGENSKPGESRMKLKETLQHKIAKCRKQQFTKRLEEYKLNEEEIYGEEKLISDEDLEEELTVTESENDSEIDDDVLIKDDINEKNPFIDEEAEESENDDEEIEKEECGLDAENDSDADSIDVGPLVDRDEDVSHMEIGLHQSSRNSNGLMELCSGVFTSKAVSLNELEKNDSTFSQLEMNVKSISSFDISKPEEDTPAEVEDLEEEIIVKKKKKCKLTFSDDEDDEVTNNENSGFPEESGNSEGEIDEDNDENEKLFNEDEVESLEEEDEEITHADVSKKAAKRFLEAEAELSGSEWGSADEDEIELDCMEKEEGDDDVINQRKVRSELEKIHMKELLVEDKREIRALQELFLEDGDLHSDGPKRERQFRWYNQDGENENGNFLWNLDGDVKDNVEEDEEDESWRKTRLDRENFLRNQKTEDQDLNITNENIKFLKFPKKSIVNPSPKPSAFVSPDPRKQFSLISRRGSFLSRGEKILSKLAELTNVSGDNAVGNVRGQRNMVFAVVSPPKEESKEMSLKRKNINDIPVIASKKLKFSPPTNKRQGSLFEKLKMVD